MNIVSQHKTLNYISILNKMDCNYLHNCFINENFIVVDKQKVIDGLMVSFLAICSDINSVYLLSAINNINDDIFIENLRLTLKLLNKEGEKVGDNQENICKQCKIDNIVYTLSILDINKPLELDECEIVLTEIRRNNKTLIKSEHPIIEISNDYQMPLQPDSSIGIEIENVLFNKNIFSYEFTVIPNKNEFNYNMLISLSRNENPLLAITDFNSGTTFNKPVLLEYNRLENTNSYKCVYDLKNMKYEDFSKFYYYYYTVSIEKTSCDFRINYNLSNGYHGVTHLIKVDRAIDINKRLFKVKEFRIGNITTRIIIEGSLLSICDTVDNVLKIYNGKKKLDLISAKCTSKKTIFEFQTNVQESNLITVKIADKYL